MRCDLLRRLTRLQIEDLGRLVRRASKEFCPVLAFPESAEPLHQMQDIPQPTFDHDNPNAGPSCCTLALGTTCPVFGLTSYTLT